MHLEHLKRDFTPKITLKRREDSTLVIINGQVHLDRLYDADQSRSYWYLHICNALYDISDLVNLTLRPGYLQQIEIKFAVKGREYKFTLLPYQKEKKQLSGASIQITLPDSTNNTIVISRAIRVDMENVHGAQFVTLSQSSVHDFYTQEELDLSEEYRPMYERACSLHESLKEISRAMLTKQPPVSKDGSVCPVYEFKGDNQEMENLIFVSDRYDFMFLRKTERDVRLVSLNEGTVMIRRSYVKMVKHILEVLSQICREELQSRLQFVGMARQLCEGRVLFDVKGRILMV